MPWWAILPQLVYRTLDRFSRFSGTDILDSLYRRIIEHEISMKHIAETVVTILSVMNAVRSNIEGDPACNYPMATGHS